MCFPLFNIDNNMLQYCTKRRENIYDLYITCIYFEVVVDPKAERF